MTMSPNTASGQRFVLINSSYCNGPTIYAGCLIFIGFNLTTVVNCWSRKAIYSIASIAFQVGLTKESVVFVLAGSEKWKPDICATIKPEELKKYKACN